MPPQPVPEDGMLSFLGSRLLRMAITLWAIVTAVFLATRLTGNPIDFLMPEGLDAASRAEMIAYWGLDRPVAEQYLLFWKSIGLPVSRVARKTAVTIAQSVMVMRRRRLPRNASMAPSVSGYFALFDRFGRLRWEPSVSLP